MSEKWKLVPVEPDEVMCRPSDEWADRETNAKIYRAMLSASPAPPDVVGVLEFYACKCPDGGCEVGDMEAVCCGNKARVRLAQLKGETP